MDDARFWDRIARRYARDSIKDIAGYERTLDRSIALLRPADTVLEIGCGTGTTALRIAPHVARLTGSDISAEMIAIAREKGQACPNTSFTTEVPDAPGAFDAVLAFNLLHLVRDRAACLRQVQHVLKPGGLFISKTPCLSEMNPLLRIAVPPMQWLGKAPHVAFFSAAMLEAEITAAGFTLIERARHGSGRRDARVFLVAARPG